MCGFFGIPFRLQGLTLGDQHIQLQYNLVVAADRKADGDRPSSCTQAGAEGNGIVAYAEYS